MKIIQTNKNGWPDLQAHRDGVTVFIEVKTETGRLSKLQEYRHKQLREKGFDVIIAKNVNDVYRII